MATGVLDAMQATAAERDAPTRPRWWRITRAVLLGLTIGAVVASPWWGPRLLSQLAFFHVRQVLFEGMRYTSATEALKRLKVDTSQSVWQPLEPLSDRLEAHPLIASAVVERQLPSTILIHVVEREPVALVRRKGGQLDPVDATGHRLPIDPVRVPMDVPLATSADSALMQLLDRLRTSSPALYARIERADRVGPSEFRIRLDAFVVRTRSDVTVARFKDILPVEADLARNRLRAVEIDLRFRDQVIARQP